MAASVFVRLAAEIQALLQAAPALANGRVWLGRQAPVVAQVQSGINVRLDGSEAVDQGVTGSPTTWMTAIDVECYARGDPESDAVAVVDPLLVGVYERLAEASTLPSLLELGVQDVLPNPRIEWDRGDGTQSHVAAVITVRIVHRTRPGSLQPWA